MKLKIKNNATIEELNIAKIGRNDIGTNVISYDKNNIIQLNSNNYAKSELEIVANTIYELASRGLLEKLDD